MRPLLAAAALVGCGSQPPPPISGTRTSSAIASCAVATPRRSRVQLRPETWLGRIGDRSWLLAERGKEHVLVTIGDDGALAVTPLPGSSRDKLATTVDGTHLWIDRDPLGPGNNEVLFDLDLSTSRPVVTRAEALPAKTLPGTSSLGISAVRMLAYTFTASSPGPGFQLWDREHHAPIATQTYSIYGIDEPPVRCVRDHCFAVTRPDTAGRSFASQRFAPDGTTATEPLTADDRIGSYVLVPDGDRTHVVWEGFARSGLYARTLDATGHPIDDEVALVTSKARDVQRVPGAPDALAFRDDHGWSVATLVPGDRALEPARRIGFPDAPFLTIAQTGDGALAMAFSTDVPIDTVVPATTASAVFVPTTGPAAAPIDVLFGQRRVGWAPFPLVAPGYAAALVLAQGGGDLEGELAILREPCAR